MRKHFERVGKHQMGVERERGMFAQGTDQGGPDRQIRHKMTVHHIEMKQVGDQLRELEKNN